jgi:hypothetical protein
MLRESRRSLSDVMYLFRRASQYLRMAFEHSSRESRISMSNTRERGARRAISESAAVITSIFDSVHNIDNPLEILYLRRCEGFVLRHTDGEGLGGQLFSLSRPAAVTLAAPPQPAETIAKSSRKPPIHFCPWPWWWLSLSSSSSANFVGDIPCDRSSSSRMMVFS